MEMRLTNEMVVLLKAAVSTTDSCVIVTNDKFE